MKRLVGLDEHVLVPFRAPHLRPPKKGETRPATPELREEMSRNIRGSILQSEEAKKRAFKVFDEDGESPVRNFNDFKEGFNQLGIPGDRKQIRELYKRCSTERGGVSLKKFAQGAGMTQSRDPHFIPERKVSFEDRPPTTDYDDDVPRETEAGLVFPVRGPFVRPSDGELGKERIDKAREAKRREREAKMKEIEDLAMGRTTDRSRWRPEVESIDVSDFKFDTREFTRNGGALYTTLQPLGHGMRTARRSRDPQKSHRSLLDGQMDVKKLGGTVPSLWSSSNLTNLKPQRVMGEAGVLINM